MWATFFCCWGRGAPFWFTQDYGCVGEISECQLQAYRCLYSPNLKIFPGGSEVKASASNVGDLGLIPGSGWRIPWTEKPVRLLSTGSQRVGHNWATSLTYLLNLKTQKAIGQCIFRVRDNNFYENKDLLKITCYQFLWNHYGKQLINKLLNYSIPITLPSY